MKKILLLFCFLNILWPFRADAAFSKTVVINELMWMGSSKSTADEWLELRNLTDQDIDISGWQIEGAAGSGKSLIIPEGKIIKTSGYFLISNYAKGDEKTILDIDSDWVTTAISLSNNNPKYYLRNKGGILIDEIEKDKGEPLAGDNDLKYSMERVENPRDGTKARDWHTATEPHGFKLDSTERGTPGFPNSSAPNLPISKIKSTKDLQEEIIIRGVVVCLPNLFFEQRAYIQDETGGIRLKLEDGLWPKLSLGSVVKVKGKINSYYTEKELILRDESEIDLVSNEAIKPFNIKTGQITLFEGALVKISGQISETSGDTFYVDDGSGPAKIYIKEETRINLPKKHKGDQAEIIGIVNNWSGNFRILPRYSEDVVIVPQPKKEEVILNLSIKETKKQPKGTKVRVKGVVSVEPNVLSKTYFYIQDSEAGIQIYSYYKRFPTLKLGDFVEVIGEISEIYGEKRIKIKIPEDIIILCSRSPPVPQKIKIKSVASYSGMLVKVRGTVIKTSGSTFYISDGTGIIKIYIQKLTGIKKPRLKKGAIVEIIGIVSQTKTGYRILPRYQKDFKLIYLPPNKTKKSKVKGSSVAHAESLNEPKVIFDARSEKGDSLLNLIGWGLIVVSLGFLIYLKRLEFNSKS